MAKDCKTALVGNDKLSYYSKSSRHYSNKKNGVKCTENKQ